MAIVCPECGRNYDVTLFQFGRTIDCACGARVGRDHSIPLENSEGSSEGDRRGSAAPHPVRFLADAMLGGLARWLRILGYDTTCDPAIEDARLARRAVEEGRRVLTRDRRFPEEWRIEGVVVVEAEEPLAQLREVVERLGLEPDDERAFTRCSECNAELEEAEVGEVRERVPENVLERHRTFRRCPSCDRVYWEGGHVRRMRRRLDDVLG